MDMKRETPYPILEQSFTRAAEKTGEKPSLLPHFARIAGLAKKHGLKTKFLEEAKTPLEAVTAVLRISPVQAALFALLMELGDEDDPIGAIGKAIKCGRIELLNYLDDFEALEQKNLIHAVRRHGIEFLRDRGDSSFPRYTVPMPVIKALRKGKAYKRAAYAKLSPEAFFDIADEVLQALKEDDICIEDAVRELKAIIAANRSLAFVKNLSHYDLQEGSILVLLIFCEALIQEGTERHTTAMLRPFIGGGETRRTSQRFKSGEHKLIKYGLAEPDCDNGMADTEYYRLTDKAKSELLSEIDLKEKTKHRGKNIIRAETLKEKRDYDDWLMIAATGGIDWNNPPPEEMWSEELCIADVQDAAPEHLGKMPERLRTEAVCRAAVFIDDGALESFVPTPLREKVRAWKDAITPEEWLEELTYWYNPNHYLKLPQKLLTPSFLREMVTRNRDTISLVPEEIITGELRALAKTGGDRFEQYIKRLKDGTGVPQPLSTSGTAMVMENAMRPAYHAGRGAGRPKTGGGND